MACICLIFDYLPVLYRMLILKFVPGTAQNNDLILTAVNIVYPFYRITRVS